MLKGASTAKNLYLILPLFLLIAHVSCSRKADKEESRKYLRAFDAEISNHTRKIVGSRSFEAIRKLLYLPGTPLPMISHNIKLSPDSITAYSLEKASGCYSFDAQNQQWFSTKAGTDSIPLQLLFNDREGDALEFQLLEYTESVSALGMTIPTRMKARLLDTKHQLLGLEYRSTLREGFPEEAWLKLNLAAYECNFELSTKFTGRKSADVEIQLLISKDNTQLIRSMLSAETTIGDHGTLYYNNLSATIEAFPLRVSLQSDYSAEKIARNDFFDNWNKLSSIQVKTQEGVLLGNIMVRRLPESDRINLMMHYNDGSEENLEELMLLIKAILNVKIVRYSD